MRKKLIAFMTLLLVVMMLPWTAMATEPETVNDETIQEETVSENTAQNNIVLLIGDSYAAGIGEYVVEKTTEGTLYWPEFMPGKSDEYEYYTVSKSGIGFVSKRNGKTFVSMLDEGVSLLKQEGKEPANVAWIILEGGHNDRRYASEDIANEIGRFVSTANTLYPNAKVAIGMFGWTKPGRGDSERNRVQYKSNVYEPYKEATLKNGAIYINNAEYFLRNKEYLIDDEDKAHPTSDGADTLAQFITDFMTEYDSDKLEITFYDRVNEDELGNAEYEIGSKLDKYKADGDYEIIGWSHLKNSDIPEYEQGEEISEDVFNDNHPNLDLYAVYGCDEKFTGFKEIDGRYIYFKNGRLTDTNQVVQGTIGDETGWWYIGDDNAFDDTYNGFAYNASGYWFVENGKVNFSKTSIVQGRIKGTTTDWNVVNGRLTAGPTLADSEEGLKYISSKGSVDDSYTGFVEYNDEWYYAENGAPSYDAEGLVKGTVNDVTGYYNGVCPIMGRRFLFANL